MDKKCKHVFFTSRVEKDFTTQCNGAAAINGSYAILIHMKKKGETIIPSGVIPEKHEIKTTDFFTRLGKSVEFLRPSNTKKSPDIMMDGHKWEIKSPKNAGKYTIEHAIEAASKQSSYVIIDLRRSKTPEQKALVKITREATYRKRLKKVLVITKTGRLLDVK